jgi:uncharacterized protein YfaQ (DUF2300 family)
MIRRSSSFLGGPRTAKYVREARRATEQRAVAVPSLLALRWNTPTRWSHFFNQARCHHDELLASFRLEQPAKAKEAAN